MPFFETPNIQDLTLQREFPAICTDKINSIRALDFILVKIFRGVEQHILGIDPELIAKEYSFKSHIHIPDYGRNDMGYFRLYKSQNNNNDEAVIIVPPRRGAYGYNHARLLASYLASNGFDAYEIVTPFHEKRLPEGIKSVVQLPVDVEKIKLTTKQAIEEILDLVNLVSLTGYRRIGIAGISQGAAYVAIVSGLDKRIKSSAYIHGFGNITSLLLYADEKFARHFREELGSIDELVLGRELKEVEPLNYASGINAENVVMVNARNDKSLPEANVRALFEALGKPQLYWFGGGHFCVAINSKKILKLVLAHFQGTLQK